MVNRISDKKGFSFAEVLISMLILSVFFIATSKVMTHRQPRETQENPHGFYECYAVGTDLKQRRGAESSVTPEQSVTSCTFTPPQGLAYATIYAIAIINDNVRIYKSVEPQFNNAIDPIGSVNELANFYELIQDAEETDLTMNDMKTFLEMSYPRSGLYSKITTVENYRGPALFIGW